MNLRSRVSAWSRQLHHARPTRHRHHGQASGSIRGLAGLRGPGLVFRVVAATHVKQDMDQGGAVARNETNGEAGGGRAVGTGRCETDTHFFRMPMKMRSLELSLWFSSGGGAIVGGAPDADMLEGRGVGRTAKQRGRGAEARLARTSCLV